VGSSIYHGLQLSVQKQMSHGLQISGNYTWSHAIDSGSGWVGGETVNGLSAGDAASTDFTLPGLDRGNSTFDIRHRLTFNYVWELPFFRLSPMAADDAGWLAMERNLVVPEWRTGRPTDQAWSGFRPMWVPDACDPGTFDAHCGTGVPTSIWMGRQ
jgi:hypothetical protein